MKVKRLYPSKRKRAIKSRFPRKKKVKRKSKSCNFPRQKVLDKIEAKVSSAVYFNKKSGTVRKLNDRYFARLFTKVHSILFEPSLNGFYRYNAANGVWGNTTETKLLNQIGSVIKMYADNQGKPEINEKNDTNFQRNVLTQLKGNTEKKDAFKTKNGILHLDNCMLDINEYPPSEKKFSKKYYSTYQVPIRYDPKAICPKFIDKLLIPVLLAYDLDLLQRVSGAILYGGNKAQRVEIIEGSGGTGKSQFVEILEVIIGKEKCHELRIQNMDSRFEISRLLGKTLLVGEDVPGDFLNRKFSHKIKALTGGGHHSVESKNSNATLQIQGKFNILITCNSELQVKLDGDYSAWERRLIIIPFQSHKPKKRIPNFAQMLLREEGPGILNWMIEGYKKHRTELKSFADFNLNITQKRRVKNLLNESTPLQIFGQTCVKKAKGDVTTDELVNAYFKFKFSQNRKWEELTRRQVERGLPGIILELFHVIRRKDIKRGGKARRGYKGIKLK